jgi:hypothetical protein
MNQTQRLFGVTAGGARWLLPWLSVLALSASAACAVTVGVGRLPSAESAGISATCDTTVVRMMYFGLNSWVPAEPGTALRRWRAVKPVPRRKPAVRIEATSQEPRRGNTATGSVGAVPRSIITISS